ncbi:hypothetical protein ACFYLX_02690 [Pseudarthrobacter enclensis]|jgi:hypothetical protein|uniref:hypothetical protein n=1 Tax=Pseudarthrobacter enclensis TaxID=993070 RepID=UPI003695BCB8
MVDSAGPEKPDELPRDPGTAGKPARFARPALVVGAVLAVVCLALLVIIFFLDTFNATVYSVGGNNIGDNTQEARDIRGLYSGARAAGTAVLVVSLLVVAGSSVVLYRTRNRGNSSDPGEDVDFDDLGR